MDQALDYANHLKAIQNIYILPLDICNIIVKYVADQNTINKHFIEASSNGHLEVVRFLAKNGADITAENNLAVIWASCSCHLQVVIFLHANRADITARYNLAVQLASSNGHLEVVKFLHAHGADITAEENLSIRYASFHGHLEVVKLLTATIKTQNSQLHLGILHKMAILYRLSFFQLIN